METVSDYYLLGTLLGIMGPRADMNKIGETAYTEIEAHINKMGQKDIHENFEHWCREWALEAFFPGSDQTELVGKVIGESGELGVDSYIIHQPSKRVVIIQSKWHYKDDKEPSELIAKLRGCLSILGDSSATSRISSNKKRIQMDEEIESLAESLNDPTDISFEILLISNQDNKNTTEEFAKTPVSLSIYGETEKIICWGPLEVERRYQIEAGLKIEPVVNEDRKLEGHFLFSDTDEGLVIGYVKTAAMKTFFGVPTNTAKKDLRLLAPNIRMRKAAGKNSKKEAKDPAERIAYRMRQTLIDHPAEFARRNNGLQIVVDDFQIKGSVWKQGDAYFNGEIELINPGVSNGGQTIQEIWDGEDTELANSRVVVKIIKCETLTERGENAISSNSQNATVPRNFRANDEDMQTLKRKFASFDPKIFLDVKEKEWENSCAVESMKTNYPGGPFANEWVGKLIWAWYGGWGQVNAATSDMWHGELTTDLFDQNKSELKHTYALPEKLGNKPVKISAKGTEFVEVTILAAFLENLWYTIKGHKTAKKNMFGLGTDDRENVLKKNLFCGSGWPAFIGLVNFTMNKRQIKPSELLQHLIGQKYTEGDYPRWILKRGHKNYQDIVGGLNNDTSKYQIIKRDHVPSEEKFKAAQKWAYSLYNCMFLGSSEWQSNGNDLSAANLYHSSGHQDFIHRCVTQINDIFDKDREDECFPIPSSGTIKASQGPTLTAADGGDSAHRLPTARQRILGWTTQIQNGKMNEEKFKNRATKGIDLVLLLKKEDVDAYENLNEACEDYLEIQLDDYIASISDSQGTEIGSVTDASDEKKHDEGSDIPKEISAEAPTSVDSQSEEINKTGKYIFTPGENLL